MPVILAGISIVSSADEITGTVLALNDGKPLAGVVVTLRDSSGRIFDFLQTGEDGRFTLEWNGTDKPHIEARLMGFKTATLTAPFPDPVILRLEEDPFTLPEVTVRAEKMEIEGDTIRYYMETLLEPGDRVLGDVLTKLTGVDVSEDGYVQYLGRGISRMYIDSTDLLESQYNLATLNLKPEDIKSIEIYEGHQHIKALRGKIRPQQAAINILLKDHAKGKWLATVKAEAGGSTQKPWVPYSASGLLMNVGGKMQTFGIPRHQPFQSAHR